MTTSRLLAVAEIHGPYVGACVRQTLFADAKARCSNFWNGGERRQNALLFVPHAPGAEHKFISATEIRRSSDIAVMAQSQRNAVIPVALSAQ
jgi:hypothetical protein